MQRFKKGFTLVELLVVIAIIALLLAILMPALSKVRLQARMVVCQTRQKSVLTCLNLYMNDWRGKLMPSIQGKQQNPRSGIVGYWTIPNRVKYYFGSGGANGGSLVSQFSTYMSNPKHYNCPVSLQSLEREQQFFNAQSNAKVLTLNGSYFYLWNYLRFTPNNRNTTDADKTLLHSVNPVLGKDNLMIMDVFANGMSYPAGINGDTPWVSSHKLTGSNLADYKDVDELLSKKLKLYVTYKFSSTQVPTASINCGFLDGHVSAMNPATQFQQTIDRIGYWFPKSLK